MSKDNKQILSSEIQTKRFQDLNGLYRSDEVDEYLELVAIQMKALEDAIKESKQELDILRLEKHKLQDQYDDLSSIKNTADMKRNNQYNESVQEGDPINRIFALESQFADIKSSLDLLISKIDNPKHK